MNQYRVTSDEAYVVSSVDCYRRQKSVYPWFLLVKGVCALGLSLLIAAIVYGVTVTNGKVMPLMLVTTVLVVFLVLLFLGPRIDYYFLRRRLRKSPFYGDEMLIEVSEAGVSVNAARFQTTLQWSAFSRARRLDAGFLVFTDPTAFLWWPDATLFVGAPIDVERLLQSKLQVYEGRLVGGTRE